ncbi:hypothetical protein AK830_g7189 [Neonectria ditissima]|uniref:Protein kinase domain-containing protein n=1 Tax=Neonectria ditissima TaxID=78410 RepID=A0A0P7BAP5_9HYPO|nr:hypothetical protein AK830_g7189 [Neonectria ditissima]
MFLGAEVQRGEHGSYCTLPDQYGKELQKLCSSLKSAESEIRERLLRLENFWLRCRTQLEFLKRVEPMMDESHRELVEQTLRMFLSKLETVTALLKRLLKPRNASDGPVVDAETVPKRIKYAFKKESLDEAIDALEIWQRVSDPSWFLLLRIADRQLDSELSSNGSETASTIPSTLMIRSGLQEVGQDTNSTSGISLPPEALKKMRISGIQFCDAQAAEVAGSTRAAMYILSRINCPPLVKYHNTKKDIRDLARKLQHDEPHTFGLLNCKGFITKLLNDGDNTRAAFTMVFRIPLGLSSPRSLRDLLLNAPTPSSLSQRFEMAQELAKAVSYVHTFGFVHKNIRPESILSFGSPNTPTRSVFLVGFENFRREEGNTQRRGDDVPERNLYRHPTRQGPTPQDDYLMQHDIYSLGVCLLEVGLWQSFFQYDVENGSTVASALLGIPPDSTTKHVAYYLSTTGKSHLLSLTRSELRQCMGTKYAEVVETCLTCLDPDNTDFGDQRQFEDEDGIRVGVRYIEKVLYRLNMLYV